MDDFVRVSQVAEQFTAYCKIHHRVRENLIQAASRGNLSEGEIFAVCRDQKCDALIGATVEFVERRGIMIQVLNFNGVFISPEKFDGTAVGCYANPPVALN